MKYLILATVLSFFSIGASAQEKAQSGKHSFEVKGNCEMCKKRIEKAAYAVKGVRSAVWSSETQQIDVLLNASKTDEKKVQEAIAAKGHDTQGVKAEKATYDALHSCCQYVR